MADYICVALISFVSVYHHIILGQLFGTQMVQDLEREPGGHIIFLGD